MTMMMMMMMRVMMRVIACCVHTRADAYREDGRETVVIQQLQHSTGRVVL